ncbi:hypothetical protein BSKO_06587 [Bryopsis sp. KO-2023]|nr:hypothetical protein BSKO_06587 [Bryopsis sp. KO-2023]
MRWVRTGDVAEGQLRKPGFRDTEPRALVNVPDADGFTPLDSAAQGGFVEIVKLLIDAGANVEARDNDGGTALYAAAGKGHLAVVQVLLEAGANVESRFTETDDTALIFSADQGHHDVAAALIKAGADVDATNRDGFFPLYRAGLSGYPKVVKLLVESGASMEMRLEGSGETSLMAAAFGGHTGTVKQLIISGVDVNAANIFGQTALHKAPLQFDRLGVAKALVDGGGFVNLEDNKANTPLHIASQFGRKNTSSFMLRVGADPELVNLDFLTPREVICQCKEFVAFPSSIQCSRGQCDAPEDVKEIRSLIDTVGEDSGVLGQTEFIASEGGGAETRDPTRKARNEAERNDSNSDNEGDGSRQTNGEDAVPTRSSGNRFFVLEGAGVQSNHGENL